MLKKDVLKRFVRDYDLPIKIFSEETFNYLLDLYEDSLGSRTKYNLLVETVSKFESEDKFLSNYYDIRNRVINAVKETEAFNDFNTGSMSEYKVESDYPQRNAFNIDNVGKTLVSIDLVKANFQALKYVDKDIVLGCDTYKEFLSKFTDLDYMLNSKYLRQFIFRNLNHKRQMKVEKYLMFNLLNGLLGDRINKEDIISLYTDEIIFELKENREIDLEELTAYIKNKFSLDVNIEVYKLSRLGDKGYYVKNFVSKEGKELACVPDIYYPQAYKKMYGLEVNDYDLMFVHEGLIAKFLEPLF